MQDVTIYQGSYLLSLPQASGNHLQVVIPGLAEGDAAFLVTWLYGKSEKTQRVYITDIRKLLRTAETVR